MPRSLEKQAQRFARVAVILGDQHAAGREASFLVGRFDRGAVARRTRRQVDAELASLIDARALGRNRPAVELGEPPYERQPDAEAAARPVERLLALDEEIEDPRQQVGVDALSVVAHAELRVLFVALDGELDLSALGRVLDRVLDEIRDDLLEADRVAVDEDGLAGEAEEVA